MASDIDANGSSFLQGMDLANDDLGAIGVADADGGAVRGAADVVPDVYDYDVQPMEQFHLTWPIVNEFSLASRESTALQVGGEVGATLEVGLFGVSSANLGLDAIDVEDPDSFPIGRVDRAMELLSESQSSVGAAMSRLESALDVEAGVMASTSEGEARVRDADFAVEAAAFAKARLRDQVTTSLLARADVQSDVVLSLLEGL